MTATFIPGGAKLPIIALITSALFHGATREEKIAKPEKQIEDSYNEMMLNWLNAPAKWLNGEKPGEYFLVALLLGFDVEHRPVELVVAVGLQRIAADEARGWADEPVERLHVFLDHGGVAQLIVVFSRRIARYDEQHGDAPLVAAEFRNIVRQVLEEQPLV